MEENHFYPFGQALESDYFVGGANPYRYNGKERVDAFDLGWYDYGARWYAAELGRWGSVDPLAEKYLSYSPYNYVINNPLRYTDPNGMEIIPVSGGVKYTEEDAIEMFKKYQKAASTHTNDKHKSDPKADLYKLKDLTETEKLVEDSDNEKLVEDSDFAFSKINNYENSSHSGPPYFYNGKQYHDENSLYAAILLDQTAEQIGIKDLAALAMIVAG